MIAKQPKTIQVADDAQLGPLLDEARDAPLVLERGHERYRLESEDPDIWSGYSPERARVAVDATAGSWADVDPERLLAEIQRWRDEWGGHPK